MVKALLFFCILGFIFGGCANESKEAGNPTVPAPGNLSNSGSNSSEKHPARVKSEKITSPIDVEFDDKLPEDWQKSDNASQGGSEFSTDAGALKLKLAPGRSLNEQYKNAPRFLKRISGDFELETKVKFDPKDDFQSAGLLIWVDEENFIRLERAYEGTDSGVRFTKSGNGTIAVVSETGQNPTESTNIELKIVRKMDEYFAFIRENIDGEWKEIGFVESKFPDRISVGVSGISTSSAAAAEFSYLRIFPLTK